MRVSNLGGKNTFLSAKSKAEMDHFVKLQQAIKIEQS